MVSHRRPPCLAPYSCVKHFRSCFEKPDIRWTSAVSPQFPGTTINRAQRRLQTTRAHRAANPRKPGGGSAVMRRVLPTGPITGRRTRNQCDDEADDENAASASRRRSPRVPSLPACFMRLSTKRHHIAGSSQKDPAPGRFVGRGHEGPQAHRLPLPRGGSPWRRTGCPCLGARRLLFAWF